MRESRTSPRALSGDYRPKAAAILAAGAVIVLHYDRIARKSERAQKALRAEFGHYFEAFA